MFKKTLKVDLSTIEKMHLGEYKVSEKMVDAEVTLKDGPIYPTVDEELSVE